MSGGDSSEPLLAIDDLRVVFDTERGQLTAVDGLSFGVARGETVALVGETGSGKTVTGEAISRLFDEPPAQIVGGSITIDGTDVVGASEATCRDLRRTTVSHVAQEPARALNPVHTVGWQLREALACTDGGGDQRRRALELCRQVGLGDPGTTLAAYPHELSGGQCQRVLLAIALASEPSLLVADEPTTALDVTTQADILRSLARIQTRHDIGLLLITHDLGVVASIADRVVVTYAGRLCEVGPVESILEAPAHPYTRALLACLPDRGELAGIPGSLPSAIEPPTGCRFADRCPYAVDACTGDEPPGLVPVADDPAHRVACVHYEPGGSPARVRDSDLEADFERVRGDHRE